MYHTPLLDNIIKLQHERRCSQVPTLHNLCDITLSKDSNVALVSFEHKAPELWKLELIKDRNNEAGFVRRISPVHTYMPKGPADFVRPGYFGGRDDQLVLCSTSG